MAKRKKRTKPIITVCTFADKIGDFEDDWRHFETHAAKLWLDDCDVCFTHDVRPQEMMQRSADVYMIDFGGLAALVGYGSSGGDLVHYAEGLQKLVEERPSLLVVVMSSFTSRIYWNQVGDERPELRDAPNVVLYDFGGGDLRDLEKRERLDIRGVRKRVREWFADRLPKKRKRRR
jgi:hypothetical protein